MGELAKSTIPVSSFRSYLTNLHSPPNHERSHSLYLCALKSFSSPSCTLSDTFFLLANQSLDPNLQEIAASYIVHYDYNEVNQWKMTMTENDDYNEVKLIGCMKIFMITSSTMITSRSRNFLISVQPRLWTTSPTTKWWWQRQGSGWTSS